MAKGGFMRIKKFCIKNYRSILDSGEVNMNKDITTLIGKNGSGKTCILKSLESFEKTHKYTKDELCKNSEIEKELSSGKIEDKDIEIITIWFDIEPNDKKVLKEINPKLEKLKIVKVTKYFDNLYNVESPDISFENLEVNTRKEIDKQLSKIKDSATSLKKKLDKHIDRYPPLKNSKPQYDAIIDSIIHPSPETMSDIENYFNNLNNNLKKLPSQDVPIQNDVNAFIAEINPYVKNIKEILFKAGGTEEEILKILPNFIYFSDVQKISDSVPIQGYLSDKEKYKTLSNLIELSGINIDYIVKQAKGHEALSKLKLASTTITGMINKSWTQEKVQVNIGIWKDQIVTSIYDNIAKDWLPPSIRSQGFQWFLSFYINFMAGSKGEFKNTILLLDDPGVYLHPSGQKDLLKTLEKIAESNQIIFSTHSPFMVDREKLDRIRIVSKQIEKGTLINEKYYDSDFDALQPIRASIGMTIGDSLFTTKKNLLVEGYSDELILQAMSKVCSQKGKDSIDTSKISILPVIGADKMPYFTTLLLKENLKFLILLDFDTKGRNVADKLKTKFNVKENLILTFDKAFSKEAGKDLIIEDLIDIDFYIKAVNLAYSGIFEKKLHKKSITLKELKEPSFAGINKFFKEKKIGESKKVDKIKVAKKILDLVAEDKEPNKKTISYFSKLFKIINKRM